MVDHLKKAALRCDVSSAQPLAEPRSPLSGLVGYDCNSHLHRKITG